jgi:hypothetical protein
MVKMAAKRKLAPITVPTMADIPVSVPRVDLGAEVTYQGKRYTVVSVSPTLAKRIMLGLVPVGAPATARRISRYTDEVSA